MSVLYIQNFYHGPTLALIKVVFMCICLCLLQARNLTNVKFAGRRSANLQISSPTVESTPVSSRSLATSAAEPSRGKSTCAVTKRRNTPNSDPRPLSCNCCGLTGRAHHQPLDCPKSLHRLFPFHLMNGPLTSLYHKPLNQRPCAQEWRESWWMVD